MSKLVAHFEVDLPGQCLVTWPEGQDIRLDCTIGEFDTLGILGFYARGVQSWTVTLLKTVAKPDKDQSS